MKVIDTKTNLYVEVETQGEDVYFFSPLTGQKCQNINQALSGFSEQDNDLNEGWERIRDVIENGEMGEWIDQDVDYTI